jgi:hypothetical protein
MKRFLPLFVLGLGPGIGLCIALASISASMLAPRLASADPASATQTRQVPAFHAIDLAGTLEVEVSVGKPASVEITGDADLVDKLITRVDSGVLVLDTRRDQRHDRRRSRLRAIITTPDLTAVTISGTGAMKVAGIGNERLAISVPGTGELKLTGTTGTLHVELGGTGQVTAKDLAARDIVVDIAGTGQATLRATSSLDARITGTGAIEVHGHPAHVKKSVSGLGSIQLR